MPRFYGELPGLRARVARCWLTQARPIKTHAPESRYVGDAVCIRCHVEIGESYRLHPMGRSLSPMTPATASTVENAASSAHFEAGGLQYSVENRGGHVVHLETRRSPSGGIVAQSRAEVQFTVGSGRQAAGLPDRARWLPLSVADHAVRADRAVGPVPGL